MVEKKEVMKLEGSDVLQTWRTFESGEDYMNKIEIHNDV